LGLCDFTAEGPGSILGWETKIPQASKNDQKKKKKKSRQQLLLSLPMRDWDNAPSTKNISAAKQIDLHSD